ncbi:hypothetical protein PGB90_007580 [Kerria lacca]
MYTALGCNLDLNILFMTFFYRFLFTLKKVMNRRSIPYVYLESSISNVEVIMDKKLDTRRFAEKEKLRLYKWPIKAEDIRNKYDVGIIVSFGSLIPQDIIEEFPLGILNVHASLLPRWRGAAPIIHAIMNGDTETGISILKIDPHKFDTGKIIRQYAVCIKPHETAKELTHRLAVVGANILMECVRNLQRSIEYAVPQSEDNVTYAKKVFPAHAKINWKTKTAEEIYNQYRALAHLYPLTTHWFDFLIKIPNIKIDEITEMNPTNKANIQKLQLKEEIIPGLVEYSSRRSIIRIQCKDGKWIYTDSIILVKSRVLIANSFLINYIKNIKLLIKAVYL